MGWDVAIATGGWQESALLKLETSQIPYDKIPIAHSDDDYERKNIIMTAIGRAKQFYARSVYEHIVYVGDAIWDLKAANDLKIRFIGIGKALQASCVNKAFHIYDYSTDGLLNYLKGISLFA